MGNADPAILLDDDAIALKIKVIMKSQELLKEEKRREDNVR